MDIFPVNQFGDVKMVSWALFATLIVTVATLLLLAGLENKRLAAREISVIAVLGTLSALGRIPFAAMSPLQPTMYLVIVGGLIYGAPTGFLVGAMTPLISNFFAGQGPWTPWQMLVWGGMGASAGWLKNIQHSTGNWGLILLGTFWGYLYGWVMDIWFWTSFVNPLTWQSLLATCATGFAFDTTRALGNALLFFLVGPNTLKILTRFKRKSEIVLFSTNEE